MDDTKFKALAAELAKELKTEAAPPCCAICGLRLIIPAMQVGGYVYRVK